MKLYATACIWLWAWSSSTSSANPIADIHPEGQNLVAGVSNDVRSVLGKRQQFAQGEPIDKKGKGAPILGSCPF